MDIDIDNDIIQNKDENKDKYKNDKLSNNKKIDYIKKLQFKRNKLYCEDEESSKEKLLVKKFKQEKDYNRKLNQKEKENININPKDRYIRL